MIFLAKNNIQWYEHWICCKRKSSSARSLQNSVWSKHSKWSNEVNDNFLLFMEGIIMIILLKNFLIYIMVISIIQAGNLPITSIYFSQLKLHFEKTDQKELGFHHGPMYRFTFATTIYDEKWYAPKEKNLFYKKPEISCRPNPLQKVSQNATYCAIDILLRIYLCIIDNDLINFYRGLTLLVIDLQQNYFSYNET